MKYALRLTARARTDTLQARRVAPDTPLLGRQKAPMMNQQPEARSRVELRRLFKLLRISEGVSQGELGHRLGVHQSTVSNIEKGKSDMDKAVLVEVIKAFPDKSKPIQALWIEWRTEQYERELDEVRGEHRERPETNGVMAKIDAAQAALDELRRLHIETTKGDDSMTENGEE